MKNTDKLIEAFGELAYVVAMADGEVQQEEIEALERKLSNHRWGADIKWSFDYEMKKKNDPEELYKKLITYCEMHGPDPEYVFLIELLEEIARASKGIDPEEQGVMDDFVQELTNKFRNDLERINGD